MVYGVLLLQIKVRKYPAGILIPSMNGLVNGLFGVEDRVAKLARSNDSSKL